MKSFDLKTMQKQLKTPISISTLLKKNTTFISSLISTFRVVVINGGFIFEWNIFEFFGLHYVNFIEVNIAGGLNFHYFKPFRQVVVFKGLIQTGINLFYSTYCGRFGRWL